MKGLQLNIKNLQKNTEFDTKVISEIDGEGPTNRIKWIEHKKIPILFADYSNFENPEQTIKTIQRVTNYIIKLGYKEILMLIDVRNSFADEKKVVDTLKNASKETKPYLRKVAVVGVTSTQEFILKIINMFSGLGIKSFETFDDAKEWLVE